MDDLTAGANSLAISSEVALTPTFTSDSIMASAPIDVPQGQLTQQLGHHLSSITSLIGALTAKAENVDDAKKEADMWKMNFMRATRELEGLKSEVELQRDRAEKAEARTRENAGAPFSAVLIDGDGLIFHEALLKQGRTGGQKAAQSLLSSLPEIATRLPDTSAEPRKLGQIVVMIFVNKAGLAGALLKTGLIPSFSALESFLAGFTASHELFSVIDVGQGKEASDAKIRALCANAQCAMILLGASHDNGYATVLSSLKTESRLNNLLLLKGYTSLAYQIQQLDLNDRVVSLPDLFRTEKISINGKLEKRDHPPTWRPSTSGVSILTPEPTREKTGLIWSELPESAMKPIKKEKTIVIDKGSSDDEFEEDTPPEQFWNNAERKKAGVQKKSTPKLKNLVKIKKDKESVRYMNPRPCHSHYLSVEGCKIPDCPHGHDYDLTDAQLMELAKYAKQVVCPYVRGRRCRFSAEDCVYGLVCPHGFACPYGETCRFNSIPDSHPAFDTDFAIPDQRSIYKASSKASSKVSTAGSSNLGFA